MKEAPVERAFKCLEQFGFEQLKLHTSHAGTMDRLILWPKWSPAAPVMVEAKRPGKEERLLQATLRDDWRARGCDVRDMCDTVERVQELCNKLLVEAVLRWRDQTGKFYTDLPKHILTVFMNI